MSGQRPQRALPGDLVGAKEIAGLLGWPLNKVTSYALRGVAGFPTPWDHVEAGRLWLRSDIEVWARERGYLPPQPGPTKEGN